MNSHITFKLAKLLKEKGFEQMTQTMYHKSGEDFYNINEGIVTDINYFPRPIIADVVMWLLEKHVLWIYVCKDSDKMIFNFAIQRPNLYSVLSHFHLHNDFNSPKEAYEAAIEYCLTKLIK